MVLGKKPAEPEAVVMLDPQQAYDAALISLGAWLQELRVRRGVLEEAESELRQAGKYPPVHGMAGFFDLGARLETGLLKQRPELFGGERPVSRQREAVLTAEANLANAEEGLARAQRQLADLGPDIGRGDAHRQLQERVITWLEEQHRYQRAASEAYGKLGNETTQADRKRRVELAQLSAAPQTLTVSIL
jgi:hypothetical protein